MPDWETVCKEEGVPKPFHMVDFVHQKENFKTGWESEGKRLRVLDRLMMVIEKTKAMPVGAAVVLSDFNNLREEQRGRLRSPYFIAFQDVTGNCIYGPGLGHAFQVVVLNGDGYALHNVFSGS
jgi:hypothetical protein